MFNRMDTVNLGSNGLTTEQITKGLGGIQKYNPEHVVIMAGTNDAALPGPIDEPGLRRSWRLVLSDPRVIVTIAPPTRFPEMNVKLLRINTIVKEEAMSAGRQIVELPELRGADGLLPSRFTEDGVHPLPQAYSYWIQRLPF